MLRVRVTNVKQKRESEATIKNQKKNKVEENNLSKNNREWVEMNISDSKIDWTKNQFQFGCVCVSHCVRELYYELIAECTHACKPT